MKLKIPELLVIVVSIFLMMAMKSKFFPTKIKPKAAVVATAPEVKLKNVDAPKQDAKTESEHGEDFLQEMKNKKDSDLESGLKAFVTKKKEGDVTDAAVPTSTTNTEPAQAPQQ